MMFTLVIEGVHMKSIVRNKFFLIGCVLVILGLLAWGTIDSIRKNATVTFEYTPSVATLYLNDKKVSASSKVVPGTYTASVRYEGFETYEETFTVEKDATYIMYAVLVSNDPSTATWYEEHTADDLERQRIFNAQLLAESERIEKNFPIRAILPYVGPSGAYRIDYGQGTGGNQTQAVYIRYYTQRGRELANEYVESSGYKLADYEVIYEQQDFNAPGIEEGSMDFDEDSQPPESGS